MRVFQAHGRRRALIAVAVVIARTLATIAGETARWARMFQATGFRAAD